MAPVSVTELTEQRSLPLNSRRLEHSNPPDQQPKTQSSLARSNTRLSTDLESDTDTITDSESEPTDHGAAAWKMLFGAFVMEAFLWGKFLFSTNRI